MAVASSIKNMEAINSKEQITKIRKLKTVMK